ncbi:MAG: metal ABC transporter ATP-binding protein [Symbiobacteriia bacterium]
MSQPFAVEIEGVFFSYERQQALEDVTLRVKPGEFLGLVGPNGSGKSTLLRLILGLQTPQSGRISLFGQDLGRFRDWRRVGYVPQKASSLIATFPATVGEVVQTGRITQGRLFRPITREDRRLARQALKLVDLERLENAPISQLSGGQQQRVFIARALANNPELLILDEPTEGVDARTQEQFYALLHRLWRDMALTIILVSHDIGVVTTQVSNLACINRSLYYHGSPADFRLQDLSNLYGHPVAAVAHHH